ncbi:hypothetical protein LA335_11785 [Bacteroides fragilis]|uniref:hypothetical protein n=1 Tax=Bacteroides fragilis TaxID=817 RepID=UPI001CE0E597|nr:hypothetical protein [Bacteroides fragilis]MCA5602021.1 hypothetical protein [Bacteroides fragilis]
MTSTHAARKRKAHPHPQRTRHVRGNKRASTKTKVKKQSIKPPDKGPSTLLTAKNKNSL